LKDISEIQKRLDIVEIFVEDQNTCKEIRTSCFRRIPDLERISKKIQSTRGSLQDCVIIYQFISQIVDFIKVLQECSHDKADIIHEHFTSQFQLLSKEFKTFEDLVEETVDLEMIDQGEFMVNASFDEVLQELRDKIKHVKKNIEQHEDDTRAFLGDPSSLKLEQDKTHGFHFKITKKDQACLESKDAKKKYSIIQNTGKTVKFQDQNLENYSNLSTEFTQKYGEQSRSLIKEILNIAMSYMPVLETAHQVVAEIDVYTTLAYVSYSSVPPYVKPDITPASGNLELVACRHPVLEAQNDFTYIPNNANLVRGESSFQIITGPNMGGKSTYIRSIGVNVLMAQMGCFVPCQSATVPICDAILARVGASDSQLRGVSTFMAEMLETASILSTASPNSLIIIDELGRGTSTYDGFGLAWAISEYICNHLKSFCLFATHFHELIQLQEELPMVKNFHMAAEPDTKGRGLTLLYEVKSGPSDQSFGIHVAELANFPEDVIKIAKAKARELENFDTNEKLVTTEENDEEKEGKEIIQKALEYFVQQPIETLTNDELKEFLSNLRDELYQIGNPYVNTVLDDLSRTEK